MDESAASRAAPDRPTAHPGRLVLIRHGETDHNVERRLCGRTDSALSSRGHAQIERLGRHVSAAFRLDVVYASPLQRAWQTAQAITRRIGHEPIAQAELTEIDFGHLEGSTIDDFAARFPELHARWNAIEPGAPEWAWPGGESRREFHARIMRAFEPLERRSRREQVAVVCHGGVIANYLADRIAGRPDRWLDFHVHNCSISEIAWDTGGRPALLRWNIVDHLDE